MLMLNIEIKQFQHTAARRRLQLAGYQALADFAVSTHSRPKAAAEALLYIIINK